MFKNQEMEEKEEGTAQIVLRWNSPHNRIGYKKIIFPDGSSDQIQVYSAHGFMFYRVAYYMHKLLMVPASKMLTKHKTKFPTASSIEDDTIPPGPIRDFFVQMIDRACVTAFSRFATCPDLNNCNFCFLRLLGVQRQFWNNDQCPICLKDYICENENATFCVPCGHMFCDDCAGKMLRQTRTCCICRQPIVRWIRVELLDEFHHLSHESQDSIFYRTRQFAKQNLHSNFAVA